MNTAAVSIPLPFASPGEPVQVTGFVHGCCVEKRLAAMGLTPGCEVCLMQSEGGNLVVAVGNSRLALGYGLAQKILVMPI